MTIDLLGILTDAGMQRLRDGTTQIAGSCPFHADVHPSWYIDKDKLVWFCHSCGAKGNLTQLLIQLTGSAPEDLDQQIKEQSFLRKMAQTRADPEAALAGVAPAILTEWELRNRLGDPPLRLLQLRRLKLEAIHRYEVRWNRDTRQWVLPIRSPSGNLLGAQYRQKGSVLTLPSGLEKSTTLFGYSIMSQHNHVALVESPLDAVRLYGLGIPAVSSLGAWVSKEQCRLLARAFAIVYLALDDDKAGRTGTEFAAAALSRQGAAAVPWRYHNLVDEDGDRAKDLGDVNTDEEVLRSWQQTKRWGLADG